MGDRNHSHFSKVFVTKKDGTEIEIFHVADTKEVAQHFKSYKEDNRILPFTELFDFAIRNILIDGEISSDDIVIDFNEVESFDFEN